MDLIYKKATIDDIEVLTKTRIEVLRAANKLSDVVDMKEVEKTSYKYCNYSEGAIRKMPDIHNG